MLVVISVTKTTLYLMQVNLRCSILAHFCLVSARAFSYQIPKKDHLFRINTFGPFGKRKIVDFLNVQSVKDIVHLEENAPFLNMKP